MGALEYRGRPFHIYQAVKLLKLGVKLLVSPDGSSIRGFTAQRESDLRLGIDWPSFYWGPADIFGPGKLLGDAAAVSAMLDRLLHHGHVLKCGPRSWRTKTDLPPQEAAG